MTSEVNVERTTYAAQVLGPLKDEILQSMVSFCIRQWAGIQGVSIEKTGFEWPGGELRVADPEVLLVFSRVVAMVDPGLNDKLDDWVVRHRQLLNGSRLRRLSTEVVHMSGPPCRGYPDIDFSAPVSLAFRIRLILGVTCRAEVVRCLLGTGYSPLSLRHIADRVGLSRRQVDRSLSDLEQAGLVTEVDQSPVRKYVMDSGPWMSLFGWRAAEVPEFVPWISYLPACAELLSWFQDLPRDLSAADPYNLLLSADFLLERLSHRFSHVAGAAPVGFGTGDEFWDQFADYVRQGSGLLIGGIAE